MCLDATEPLDLEHPEQIRKAYKAVVVYYDGSTHFPFFHYGQSREIPRGKWLTAEPDYSNYPAYQVGFHVFLTKKAADEWRLRLLYGGSVLTKTIPVRVRNIHTKGTQCEQSCYVAEEMFVSHNAGRSHKKS